MSKAATRVHQPLPTLPYCMAIMPFGMKPDPQTGSQIDFDQLYRKCLEPAIRRAGLHPHRDDALAHGGPVPKGIFEALMLCEFAIVDLTLENGNVFYGLGIRHAVRPASTLSIAARPKLVPFDTNQLRMITYTLDQWSVLSAEAADDLRERVYAELMELRHSADDLDYADSPLFQVVNEWRPPTPQSLKTDLFREQAQIDAKISRQLLKCRRAAMAGRSDRAGRRLKRLRKRLGPPADLPGPVAIDLLLTLRAMERWHSMITLVERLPGRVRDRELVQEQYALALNRHAANRDSEHADLLRRQALDVLQHLVDTGRGSSETFGLIGRVHKDRWRAAGTSGSRAHHISQAICAYCRGFEIDATDTYPGTNAVTLLNIEGSPESQHRSRQLIPVVEFAASRLLALQRQTYWMHAALMECAVLREDQPGATVHLGGMTATVDEVWQPSTTRENLDDIIEARRGRGEPVDWVLALAEEVSALRPPDRTSR